MVHKQVQEGRLGRRELWRTWYAPEGKGQRKGSVDRHLQKACFMNEVAYERNDSTESACSAPTTQAVTVKIGENILGLGIGGLRTR